jgi:hypothetical protein
VGLELGGFDARKEVCAVSVVALFVEFVSTVNESRGRAPQIGRNVP